MFVYVRCVCMCVPVRVPIRARVFVCEALTIICRPSSAFTSESVELEVRTHAYTHLYLCFVLCACAFVLVWRERC